MPKSLDVGSMPTNSAAEVRRELGLIAFVVLNFVSILWPIYLGRADDATIIPWWLASILAIELCILALYLWPITWLADYLWRVRDSQEAYRQQVEWLRQSLTGVEIPVSLMLERVFIVGGEADGKTFRVGRGTLLTDFRLINGDDVAFTINNVAYKTNQATGVISVRRLLEWLLANRDEALDVVSKEKRIDGIRAALVTGGLSLSVRAELIGAELTLRQELDEQSIRNGGRGCA